jgi:hypothetical protein
LTAAAAAVGASVAAARLVFVLTGVTLALIEN